MSMAGEINTPFPIFYGLDGKPLDAGYIYIGTENLDPETNPITVYWDEAMTIPASQPIRTQLGYAIRAGAAAAFYAAVPVYSMTVKDSRGQIVVIRESMSSPDSLAISLMQDASDPTHGDALIAVNRGITGGQPTTVHGWISGQPINLKSDFGANGDGSDATAIIIAAIASVDTSGGKGGVINIPSGTYTVSSTINIPTRVRIIGAGSRCTTISFIGAGACFKMDGVELAEVTGMRIGFGSNASAIGVQVVTTSSDARFNRVSDLEIAGGASGQIGISNVVSGSYIITENVFDDIRTFQVDRPIFINGSEGNFYTRLSLMEHGSYGTARYGIESTSLANYIEGRVAGTVTAGSSGYYEGGFRNHVRLTVDIGSACTAVNIVGTSNIVELIRPEILTPVGTVSASTVLIDADAAVIPVKRIVSHSSSTITSAQFALSAGWGSTANVSGIVGSDQRIRFVVGSLGTGQAIYPTISYTFKDGQFPYAPIVQATRDGGNQLNVLPVSASCTTSGWTLTFGGTPVSGESYSFIVTVG
jgi:hypothetical protein